MSESPRLRAAKTFLDVFRTLDATVLNSLLAESYTHTFGPGSIKVPGPFDKQGFISHLSSINQILTSFPVTVFLDVIDSESSNSVWVHCTCVPHFKPEAIAGDIEGKEGEWEYQGEYVFMFWMDESGEKIVRCVEMLDSLGTERLMGLMKRAKQNVAGR